PDRSPVNAEMSEAVLSGVPWRGEASLIPLASAAYRLDTLANIPPSISLVSSVRNTIVLPSPLMIGPLAGATPVIIGDAGGALTSDSIPPDAENTSSVLFVSISPGTRSVARLLNAILPPSLLMTGKFENALPVVVGPVVE